MNQDIEKLLSAPLDDFERALFLAEAELHLLEAQLVADSRIAQALDQSFDNLLAAVEADAAEDDNDADFATTRTTVRRMRAFRLATADEQLTRLFHHMHALHRLYRGKAP